MSHPPARIPEQPWEYPPQHSAAQFSQAAPVGGYYARGNNLAVPTSQVQATPIWDGKERRRNGKAIIAFSIAGLGALIVIMLTAIESGASSTLVGTIVALIPLVTVLATVHWLDRWEPEPRLYLFLAFAWGGGIATSLAMYFNTRAGRSLQAEGVPSLAIEQTVTGVVAPFTEEILKGAALLGIVLWRRRLINSSVDLVVYAATIASGFAFTENILYFARGSVDGYLGVVFFGRAVLSPFAHIMFTSMTAFGLAFVMYSRKRHLWWAYPVGTGAAIGLHAAWNLTALWAGDAFFTVFLFLHVPIFFAFVLTVVLMRRRERRAIVTNLSQYAQAGWFAPHEVTMLGSLRLRSQAKRWAKSYGVRAVDRMTQFQIISTQLSLTRQHMIKAVRKNHTMLSDLQNEEREYLQQLQKIRADFLQAAGPRLENLRPVA